MAKHTHKYKRMKIGKNKDYPVFRCFVPGCTHYISEEHVVNRYSICWLCDQSFVVTPDLIRMKPICKSCKAGRKEGHKAKPIENFSLEDMLANIVAEEDEEEDE